MSEKIRFRFVTHDSKYVKRFKPLETTSAKPDAYVREVEADAMDYGFVRELVTDLERWISETPDPEKHSFTMDVSDSADVDFFRITCTASSVRGEVNPAYDPKPEWLSALRELMAMLVAEVPDAFLRNPGSLSSAIGAITAALGMGGPSAPSSDMDETVLVDAIRKNTKADIVKPKETLDDYVCDEVLKEELLEITDFFDNRKAYTDAGIEIPKGVLFKGPPGTGKTFAARCVAGTVSCYFMTCTASSLQGMYIGSGAENIRNVFNGARALNEKTGKGVIVFIDEIDSFGARGGSGGASDEVDRTINQLLAEMSGFEADDAIMVMAATNYPERMDAAMMRSGRFGRQITIDYPNEEEREAMIKHYFGKKTLPMGSATIADVVALTANMTPADIKEVANESAILTLRSKKSSIGIDEINEAINKVITKNIRHPDRDSAFVRLVSVHESGHALAEVLWLGTIPVKMTSYSYGDAGGFTQPSAIMKGIVTADRMIREIRTLLGGRAAEKVMFDHVSTGASDDLSKAKRIMKSYYETYMFEPYDKSKLDQIVLDRITLIFDEVVQAFRQNMAELNALSDALCAKRVMYSDDISTIAYKAIGRYI